MPSHFSQITANRVAKAAVKRMFYLPFYLSWKASGQAERLNDLFLGKHAGESCVVIANGPSLKNTDMEIVSGFPTFSMNRAYLAFDSWGFFPNYHVCINNLVADQFAGDLINVPSTKFYNFSSRKLFSDDSIHLLFLHLGLKDRVVTSFYQPISSAATVTFVCIQLALLMGFRRIGIIGLDHSFQGVGKVNQTLKSEGPDKNHFIDNYFGKGVRWEYPDLRRNEYGYRLLERYANEKSIEIIDLTEGGRCPVFRKGWLQKDM